MTLEEEIFAEAACLGFGAVGVAEASNCETHDRYMAWLSQGFAADMDYLVTHADARRHPSGVSSGVHSIIAVGAGYPVAQHPGRGISSYACGEDYHVALRLKLRHLSRFTAKRTTGSLFRVCIDSAPLLEREWGVRAGLGWIGRQGQLVNPQLGCCFVLGFILTDAPLTASRRRENQCGQCRLCVEACPTGAISEERTVDARSCLSYLTIEHKGDIPDSLGRLMGETLFGCDCCTAVCPWNRQDDRRVMPELTGHLPPPSAQEIAAMGPEDFSSRFAGTSIERTGLDRMQRNARCAIQNADKVTRS